MSIEEGRQLAKELNALFMECSAKTRKGVSEAFEELVRKVMSAPKIWSHERHSPKASLSRANNENENNRCAC